MLDRLIRILGYVPASSNALVPRSAALSAYGDMHRRHADGEGFHYAVGRDDWAPLAVAGFCLTDNDECRAWLNDAIRVRFWLTHDVLASWHAANQPVLRGFRGRRENHGPGQRVLLDATGEHERQPSDHPLKRVLVRLSREPQRVMSLWLEARGLTVDRRAQLVYLPGYQALYFRSDAEQWP